MPSIDIFEDDGFSVTTLTATIQEQPHVPGRLGSLGIFESEGINTTTLQIEKQGNSLSLVPAQDRGASGLVVNADKRGLIPFNTLHLPQQSTIMADEVVNVKPFGSQTEVQSVQAVVAKRQAKHRNQLDATMEHLKIGAAKGILMDADGTTPLLNIYDSFGISEPVFHLGISSETTNVQSKCMTLLDAIEDALDGLSFTGVRVECGRTFFKTLVMQKTVKDSYARYQDGAMQRDDVRKGFEYGGIIWEQYRGQVGGTKFIADNEARVIIEGVPEMYIARFAPANYMETVGTMGLPYYSKIERLPMDKGVMLESQTNPIMLCTRPQASFKVLMTAS